MVARTSTFMKRLAVDPGDKHVGWAYAPYDAPNWDVELGEWTPTEAVDRVVWMMTRRMIDELILEEFVLYEWEAKKQSWSHFLTSQLIGGLKVVAYFFRIPVVEQSATKKKPTAAQMRGRGIPRRATPSLNIHASDAELHLVHRKLRSGINDNVDGVD